MLLKHLVTFGIYTAITVSLWFLNLEYKNVELNNLFYTAAVISITHLVFRVLLEGTISRRIKDSKTRYSFRKTIKIISIIIAAIIILRIWIINPQAL